MNVLVLNSGSSSIKYQMFEMETRKVLASGLVERIAEIKSRHAYRIFSSPGIAKEKVETLSIPDHEAGFDLMIQALYEANLIQKENGLFGIGHRVVHGGQTFQKPTLINNQMIAKIKEQIPLAPLHNPANLIGIEVALARLPNIPQVGVFDTAFHQTIPIHAYTYAIPPKLSESLNIRRYGFHGTSHRYVSKAAAHMLDTALDSVNLITCHLGNGASMCAIKGGQSVDTSMGMTPLEGLIMGTRSGDIDPALIFYLARKTGKTLDELDELLNKHSGMKGLCGHNDMREIETMAEAGHSQARLALDMYCYRIKKYIGMYSAVLGRVDAVVFAAGVGENSPLIRTCSLEGLSGLGIEVDPVKNERRCDQAWEIQAESSRVKVLVIPTNEELEIAEQTVNCIQARPDK